MRYLVDETPWPTLPTPTEELDELKERQKKMNYDPRIYDRDSSDYRDLALDLIERAMEVNVPEYPDELPESYIEWIAMCNRRRMEEEKARAKELEWPTAEECAEYWRKKEL